MRKFLIKFYNSWPLRYLSDVKISFYPHPAQWALSVGVSGFDFGPLEVKYSFSRFLWTYNDVTGLSRYLPEKEYDRLLQKIVEKYKEDNQK